MSEPKRVQLRRTKGWRKPEGAIVVSRPSRWGNPFTISGYLDAYTTANEAEARKEVVHAFRDWLGGDPWASGSSPEWERRRQRFLADIGNLAGRDLACWCPLDRACHADVLLELANR